MPNLSRRHLVTTAAALPALIAREPDPIFALIDKARAAYDAHGRACKGEPVTADGNLDLDSPAYPAWQEANEATCDASWEALNDLLATPPTTRAGMAAVVRYVTDIPDAEIGKANYRAFLDSLNAHFAA
jgi:hypothetical protein